MFSLKSFLAAALLSVSASAVLADEPVNVVVSIKPVHSLVSAVMQGVGEPALIVKGAASAHGYSLKPSDAAALQSAQVVFWIGPDLETFLTKPVNTLSANARVVTLQDAAGLKLLPAREGGNFEGHNHGDDHGGHEGEHDHDAEGHSHNHDQHAHDDHDDEHYDMHLWLDPQNAKLLLGPIADALSKADPDHAKQYSDNALAYAAKLDALENEVRVELEPVRNKSFIVFHDAYQYFDKRFGLAAAGSITVSPETAPGAARIKEIQSKVKALGATCVFSEPQFESRLVNTVMEGTDAKTGILDPLGADLKDGPELYPQLIRNLATSLKTCLN